MKTLSLLLLGITLTLSSCNNRLIHIPSLSDTPGFHVGYDKLSEKEIASIYFVPTDSNTITLNQNYSNYAITANQLNQFLSEFDTTLIYIWSPSCSGAACVPISTVREICANMGYHCMIIPEYYNVFDTKEYEKNTGNLYFINHFYYKTKYCNRCNNRFIKELRTQLHLPKNEEFLGRFSLFHKNTFIENYHYIEEVEGD